MGKDTETMNASAHQSDNLSRNCSQPNTSNPTANHLCQSGRHLWRLCVNKKR